MRISSVINKVYDIKLHERMICMSIRPLIFCLTFIFVLAGPVFGQAADLLLDLSDIREMPAEYNGVAGYDIFVRQKRGMESVMLTEPGGSHALRATEWNPINGNEKRNLSGVELSDAGSRYSIVSSTPIYDYQFGRAFQLFLPGSEWVVYGNSSSSSGIVFPDIREGTRINIRTFDKKYADPNRSKFQNNQYTIETTLVNPWLPSSARPASERQSIDPIVRIRSYLEEILTSSSKKRLDNMDDRELFKTLNKAFQEE